MRKTPRFEAQSLETDSFPAGYWEKPRVLTATRLLKIAQRRIIAAALCQKVARSKPQRKVGVHSDKPSLRRLAAWFAPQGPEPLAAAHERTEWMTPTKRRTALSASGVGACLIRRKSTCGGCNFRLTCFYGQKFGRKRHSAGSRRYPARPRRVEFLIHSLLPHARDT